MTRPARPAIERLSELLRKAPNLNEVKSIHLTYRWVAAVGGLDGLDWFLMERESLGLDDLELTQSQAAWIARLRGLVARSIYDRQLERQKRQLPPLTHEERYARILRRRDEDDRRRMAIYAHVKSVEPPLAQRMAIAYDRYLLSHLKSA